MNDENFSLDKWVLFVDKYLMNLGLRIPFSLANTANTIKVYKAAMNQIIKTERKSGPSPFSGRKRRDGLISFSVWFFCFVFFFTLDTSNIIFFAKFSTQFNFQQYEVLKLGSPNNKQIILS